MLDLENFLEIVLSKWLFLLFVLADLFFFFCQIVFYCKFGFASFDFWSNHEDVIECDDNRVIIVKVFGLFEFLSKEVSVLFNHLVDHVFNHAEIHHDIILSKPMTLLQLLKFLGCIIIDERKNLLNILLNLINLLNSSFVLYNIFLILTLTLRDFLFKFFLKFFSFVVIAKTLVSEPVDLFLDLVNLVIELLILLGKFVDILAEGEVSFFCFDEI